MKHVKTLTKKAPRPAASFFSFIFAFPAALLSKGNGSVYEGIMEDKGFRD